MRFVRVVLASVLVVAALAVAAPVHAERRVALVIGNSAYQRAPALPNPKNDASDIAKEFKALGFEVIEGLDLDKIGMDGKIREFADKLTGVPMAVFFYAGHGLQVDGINYLVPIDAQAKTRAALDFEMVKLDDLQRVMGAEQGRTSLLFFDACRDNPLTRSLMASMGTRSSSVGRGLAPPQFGSGGTLISYSTQPNDVAQDGKGRNSPYTGALLKYLRTSNEHVLDMLLQVRSDVLKETNFAQWPWTNDSLLRKVYLREPPAQPVSPPVAARAPAQAPSAAPTPSPVPPGKFPAGRATGTDEPVTTPPPAASQTEPSTGPPKEARAEPPAPVTPQAPATGPPSVEPGAAGSAAGGNALALGDLAMTGFSGTKLALESLPPGVHPVEKTTIDPSRASLRVFDLTTLDAREAGLTNPSMRFDLPAGDIGQVFSLAFGEGAPDATGQRTPNLFAASTSAFGLHIVGPDKDGDGIPDRLKQGEPKATFMDGLFGSKLGGGPGTVWRIDGQSGKATVFANASMNGKPNSGPALGDVTFNPASGNLYVSDLDTGLIHRFDRDGKDVGQFDHGASGRPAQKLPTVVDDGKRADISSSSFKSEDPATWGFTQKERRVLALAVHESRLYYSVMQGPEIWSVGLQQDGSFASDPRRELKIEGSDGSSITDLVFDVSGTLILAERGAISGSYDFGKFTSPKPPRVLRYTRSQASDDTKPGAWAEKPQEYPVGFADAHKQGSGGISLSFGYRPDGTIDTSACGGTLVTTGDRLRDSPAFAAMLKSGGAAIVHGAQLSSIEPPEAATAPPSARTFIDFDGTFDDASLAGHVGDAEAFHVCPSPGEPSGFPPIAMAPPVTGPPVAEPPVTGPPVVSPPVVEGPPVVGGEGAAEVGPDAAAREAVLAGLKLEKTATTPDCSGEGGNCAFEIKVTNTQETPIDGPFVIDDALAAGTARLENAQLTRGGEAPWRCSTTAPFTCSHPGPLAGGASLALPLTFTPGSTRDETALNNCASLTAPTAVERAPSAAKAGALEIQAKPTGATCSVEVGCEQEFTIRNTGASTFEGSVTLVALFATHDGRAAAALSNDATLFEPPPPPWRCEKSGLPWRCTNPELKIEAGASQTLKFKMKPGTSGPGSRFFSTRTGLEVVTRGKTETSDFLSTNVLLETAPSRGATATDAERPGAPAEKPPASIPQTEGVTQVTACASIPLKPPPRTAGQPPRLKIEKKALSEFCPLQGPCPFEITIANGGPGAFKGPIELSESIRGGEGTTLTSATQAEASVETSSPGWTCVSEAANAACVHAEPVSLEEGQSLTLGINVMPRGWTKGNVMENCALLEGVEGDQQPGTEATEPEETCATIELDPFSLKVIKSGNDSCAPGETCAFRLTLMNDGPINHNAPVTFTDSMGSGAPSMDIVSIEPPLPCATQPTKIPFECTTPGRYKLDKGTHEEFIITTRVPAEGAGKDSLRNCASIYKPWAASGPGSSDAKKKVAALSLPPPSEPGQSECHEFKTEPVAKPCFGGMVLVSANRCACPTGSSWIGDRCATATPPPKECPAGWTGTYPYCCQAGTVYRDGACQKPVVGEAREEPLVCSGARPVGEYPNCCPKGMYYSKGKCRYPERPESPTTTSRPEPPKCKGDRPVGTYPNCCPDGTRYSNGKCRADCPDGTVYVNGACREIKVKPCPPYTKGVYPICIPDCPKGYKYKNGQCVEKRKKCPPDRPVGTPPNCCPKYTIPGANGVCGGASSTGSGGASGQFGPGAPQPQPAPPPPPPPIDKCQQQNMCGKWPNCCGDLHNSCRGCVN